MLIRMNNNPQIHPIHGRVAIDDMHLALQVRGRLPQGCACFTASSERFSHAITSAFDVTVLSAPSFKSAGIFGPVTLNK